MSTSRMTTNRSSTNRSTISSSNRTHTGSSEGPRKDPVVKNADMADEQQDYALEISTQALAKFNVEKDIAAYIKKEFDKTYGPTWHCIVGRNFGSYVTHESKNFIYYYVDQTAFLLFKSG